MKYSVKCSCQSNLNYTTSCNVWLMMNLIEESNIYLLHTILRLTNQNECVTNVAQLLCVYNTIHTFVYIWKWMVWYVKRLNSEIHCMDCMWLHIYYMPTLHAKRGLLSTYIAKSYIMLTWRYTSEYTWNSPTRSHQYNNNINKNLYENCIKWDTRLFLGFTRIRILLLLLLIRLIDIYMGLYRAANLNEMKWKAKIGYLFIFRLVNAHQFYFII